MSNTDANIWLPKNLLQSTAFMGMNNPTAIKVLMLFMIRRQFERLKTSRGDQWHIRNNGQIEFTYLEAQKKWGIPVSNFKRAVSDLVQRGFIDIAETGQGVHKVKNLYAISNRWQAYGTPDFRSPHRRPRGPINRGFQPGNRLGRNSRKQKTNCQQ